jgi:Flp pilus assembly protein TadD
MKRLRKIAPFWRILLLGILAFLLSPSPRVDEARLHLWRARQSLEANRPLEAAAHLASAAEGWPASRALWLEAGRLALQAGDPQAALGFFAQAAPLPPPDSLWAGDALLQTGDHPGAIEAYRAALLGGAPPLEVYPRLLWVHRLQGDFSSALADAQALLALSPADPEANLQMALLIAATDPSAAMPYLAQAAQRNPAQASQCLALSRAIETSLPASDPAYTFLAAGQTMAEQGLWDLAAEAMRGALRLQPAYADAWAFLGEALYHLGQDSWEPLQQALALAPDSVAANLFASIYFERRADFGQALAYANRARQADPQNPALWVEMGRLTALQGNLQAGLEYYFQAIELAPRQAETFRALALFCLQYQIQMREVALPAAREAVLLEAENPASLDAVGRVLLALGDTLTAERFLQEAWQRAPDDASVNLHLAQAVWANGRTTQARALLERVLVLAPGSAWAEQAALWLTR